MNQILLLIIFCSFSSWAIFPTHNRIANSDYVGMAILQDSTMVTFGRNEAKVRGDKLHPDGLETVYPFSSEKWIEVTGLKSGRGGFAALRSDSLLFTWGENSYDGHNGVHQSYPTQNGSDKWLALTASGVTMTAVRADSSLWYYGESEIDSLPGSRSLALLDSSKKWLWGEHSKFRVAAIASDSTLWLMGKNDNAVLGLGHSDSVNVLTQMTDIKEGPSKWLKVVLGGTFSFGIRADSTLWGWGVNQYQIITTDLPEGVELPAPIKVESTKYLDIQYSNDIYYLLAADSSIHYFKRHSSAFPTAETGVVAERTPLNVGREFEQVEWGIYNGFFINGDDLFFVGEITRNTFLNVEGATLVSNQKLESIQGQNDFVVALDTEGQVYAHGENQRGFLGDLPSVIAELTLLDSGVYQSLGGGHDSRAQFLIDQNSKLWGMGWNEDNLLGQADTLGAEVDSLVPIAHDVDWSWAASNYYHSMGIDLDSNLYTWGANEYHLLGYGPPDTGKYTTPQPILSGEKFIKACASEYLSGLIDKDSVFWGWGDASYGSSIDGVSSGFRSPRKQDIGRKWIDVFCEHEGILLTDKDSTLWYSGEFKESFGLVQQDYVTDSLGGLKVRQAILFDYESVIALAQDSTLWFRGTNVDQLFFPDEPEDSVFDWRQLSTKKFRQITDANRGLYLLDAEGKLWVWSNLETMHGIDRQEVDFEFYALENLERSNQFQDTIFLQEDFGEHRILLSEFLQSGYTPEWGTSQDSSFVNSHVSGDTLVLLSVANEYGEGNIRLNTNFSDSPIRFVDHLHLQIESVVDSLLDSLDWVGSYRDTLISIDTVFVAKDTLVTTTYWEDQLDSNYIEVSLYLDQILESKDTLVTVNQDTILLLTEVDTLYYQPLITILLDSFQVETRDTSFLEASEILPNQDTLLTHYEQLIVEIQNYEALDSLADGVSFSSDTTLYLTLRDTSQSVLQKDTLYYQPIPVVLKDTFTISSMDTLYIIEERFQENGDTLIVEAWWLQETHQSFEVTELLLEEIAQSKDTVQLDVWLETLLLNEKETIISFEDETSGLATSFTLQWLEQGVLLQLRSLSNRVQLLDALGRVLKIWKGLEIGENHLEWREFPKQNLYLRINDKTWKVSRN